MPTMSLQLNFETFLNFERSARLEARSKISLASFFDHLRHLRYARCVAAYVAIFGKLLRLATCKTLAKAEAYVKTIPVTEAQPVLAKPK